jgi:hypothetical protein
MMSPSGAAGRICGQTERQADHGCGFVAGSGFQLSRQWGMARIVVRLLMAIVLGGILGFQRAHVGKAADDSLACQGVWMLFQKTDEK